MITWSTNTCRSGIAASRPSRERNRRRRKHSFLARARHLGSGSRISTCIKALLCGKFWRGRERIAGPTFRSTLLRTGTFYFALTSENLTFLVMVLFLSESEVQPLTKLLRSPLNTLLNSGDSHGPRCWSSQPDNRSVRRVKKRGRAAWSGKAWGSDRVSSAQQFYSAIFLRSWQIFHLGHLRGNVK
jgi:hypothetical protein